MPVTRSLPRLRPATSRALRPLVTLLACATIACSGASEPHAMAASLALRSHVPTGVLRSREDRRVYIDQRYYEPIVVQALGPTGRPASRVEVTATASHSGRVAALESVEGASSVTVVTDPSGMAAFWWTPGPTVGDQAITFSALGADDLVVGVYAYWPWGMKEIVTFADSVLSVGESTTATVTFTTAAGEVITHDHTVYWSTDPRLAILSGGNATTPDGSQVTAKSPITVTAVSPGRAQISASVVIVDKIGSQSSASGSSTILVQPICDLAKASPIAPGQSVNGLMTAEDCRLDTGAPYDHYRLEVVIGQRVQVDLASRQFDPYLILLDADGNWLTGDDWSGGGTTARITFTAQATTYYLQATSLAPGVTGNYTLTAQAGP